MLVFAICYKIYDGLLETASVGRTLTFSQIFCDNSLCVLIHHLNNKGKCFFFYLAIHCIFLRSDHRIVTGVTYPKKHFANIRLIDMFYRMIMQEWHYSKIFRTQNYIIDQIVSLTNKHGYTYRNVGGTSFALRVYVGGCVYFTACGSVETEWQRLYSIVSMCKFIINTSLISITFTVKRCQARTLRMVCESRAGEY